MNSMPPNPAVSRISYAEGAAPFGELDLVRLSRNMGLGNRVMLITRALSTIRAAWSQGDWLRQVPDAQLAKGPERHRFIEQSVMSMDRAVRRPSRESAWLALSGQRAGTASASPAIPTPNPVVGYAHAKHDVSGTLAQRVFKRAFVPAKVYACVTDVAVLPDVQGQGIGVALADACLRNFDPQQVPTTYVLGTNDRLAGRLGELGFRETDSHERTDLIDGIVLQESRWQADSVAAVRARLIESFPWLHEADVKTIDS